MYALYVAIGYPCLFAYDLGTCWYLTPKLAPGAITGDAFLMEDQAAKALYNQLKQLPVGLTIERPDDMAYTNTTALSLLAGKPCWLGWCAHEQLWRNYAPEILQRYDRLNEFYDGKCTNTDWLMGSHIEYILWFKPKDTEALRASIAPSLAGKYFWMETLKCKDTSSGYWVRIH